jgi:cholesterol transport system auxiliary component
VNRFLFLCVLSCILSACGGLFLAPGEPTKKYTLAALSNESRAEGMDISAKPRPRQLIVDLPTLYPPIDSTRIALKPKEQTIDYYADVEWADRLSALIQESLIYTLQNKGMLRGVSRPTEGIHADYALKVEVRKFYVVQHGMTPDATAQVDYMAHLVKLPERHIVASRQFSHSQTIPEQTMDGITKALNTAHLEVSKALTSWVLERVR